MYMYVYTYIQTLILVVSECEDNRSYSSLHLSVIFKIFTMDILFLESEIHISVREKGTKSYHGLHMAWHCHLEGLGSCYY